MAYTKHNYQSGDKLYASQLNEMDEQIAKNESDVNRLNEEKMDKAQGVNNAGRLLYTNDDGKLDHLEVGDTLEIHETAGKNIFYGEWKNGQFSKGVWQQGSSGRRNAAVNQLFPVTPGRMYTASGRIEAELSSINFYFMQFDANKNFLSFLVKTGTSANIFPATMTLSKDTAFVAVQFYDITEAAPWTDMIPVDFMVEEGSVATAYEPYAPMKNIDVNKEPIENIESELSMIEGKTKNLNNLPYQSGTRSGVTFTANEDNSVSLAGTASDDVWVFDRLGTNAEWRYLLPAGTYTLSGTMHGYARCYACLYEKDVPTTLAATHSDSNGSGITFTTYKDYLCAVQIQINNGTNVDGLTVYPQLEAGDVKTMFISPFGKTSGRLEAIERSVDELKRGLGMFDVPVYYLESDYLPGRVAEIKAKMEESVGNGDAFVFITDAHWTQNAGNSPALIRYISENLNIAKLISGGDTGNAGGDVDFCDKLRKCFPGRVYHVFGNHEYFYPADGSLLAYNTVMYNDDVHTGAPGRNYYYFDNNRAHIRYIVLDSYSDGVQGSGAQPGYEEAQIAWLTNTALDVPDGWGIVVFTHHMYYMNLTTMALTAPPAGGQAALDALDAYNANESSKGEVICVVQGHTHHDRITHTAGGIPVIITACDKYKPWVEGDVNHEPWLSSRVEGTITEQAFDIVIVDRKERELHFFRIGGDAFNGVGDDLGEPVNLRTVTY